MASVANGDRVRVTIEGEARRVLNGNLRVEYGENAHGAVVLPTDSDGINVERLTPARQWSDGDVVQRRAGDNGVQVTLERDAATGDPDKPWTIAGVPATSRMSDDEVTGLAERDDVRVLAYAAGDDK